MSAGERTADRRAIEALRAGVPNRDAVRRLGSSHPHIEARFRQLLDQVDAGVASGSQAPGVLLTGEFGSGKSHLLEHLQHVALDAGFVCSKVVISKETSLADPARVFEAMVSDGRVPGRLGSAIPTLAACLKFEDEAYQDFFAWTDTPGAALAGQFPATLALFEYGRDVEYRQAIERFWGGAPLQLTDLKRNLRDIGKLAQYDVRPLPRKRILAFQRFRFAARLARAAGFRGWILLIDEAELIGRYTFKARANAYAELARWCGRLTDSDDGVFPGLGAIAAVTADFEANVLKGGPSDEEVIPNRLNASARVEDQLLAAQATRGMRLWNERQPLAGVTSEQMERTHHELRELYSSAFDWNAPELETCFSVRTTEVMRPHVRRWITQWDIARLYPGSTFEAEETPLQAVMYVEDADLGGGEGQGTQADFDG